MLCDREALAISIPWACSSVEASINGTATTKNPSPCIEDSIGWDEALGCWSWWSVRQGDVEVLKEGHIGVCERDSPSFKHQHTEFLWECCCQRAPCCATPQYYVVIPIIGAAGWNWWWWWEWARLSYKWVPTIPVLLTCLAIKWELLN